MSAPQFKSRDAMAVYAFNYVARRAKLDGRFKRLKGGPDVCSRLSMRRRSGFSLRRLTL